MIYHFLHSFLKWIAFMMLVSPLFFINQNSEAKTANLITNSCDCDPNRDSLALIEFRNSIKVRDTLDFDKTFDFRENVQTFDGMWPLNQKISFWEGVKLNSEGCVEELILVSKSLMGEITDEIFKDLSCVKVINFGSEKENWLNNDFDYYYDYGQNLLTGRIPESIKYLSNLQVLNLSLNDLDGKIPETLFNHPSLEEIYLQRNNLFGLVDWDIEETNNIRILDLSYNNKLYGGLPLGIDKFVNLEILNIEKNSFNRSIPESIGNLLNLKSLNLALNQFSRNIPKRIMELIELQELNLRSNNLTGEIPHGIKDLVNLKTLNLGGNNFIDEFPIEICEINNLKHLFLPSMGLTGEIPYQIGNLENLEILDLSSNGLTGEIPLEIGNLSNLESLNLNFNDLTGKLPAEIQNLNKLKFLYLLNNKIKELSPEIGHLINLEQLNLSSNELFDSIPSEIGRLANLKFLTLEGNSLSGRIPSTISKLTNLEQLDLSSNKLTGPIPYEIGQLANLKILNLNNNNLCCEMPSTITNLDSLQQLLLSNNQLEGQIPKGLPTTADLRNNLLTGTVPADFEGDISNNFLDALKLLKTNSTISVNNNRLTFDDLIPNINKLSPIDSQKSFLHNKNYIFSKCRQPIIDLKIDTNILDNTYFWYKDGEFIEQTNSNQLDLTTLFDSIEDYTGVYNCIVENSRIFSVKLYSDTINVQISPELTSEIERFYNYNLCYGEQIKILDTLYDCNNPYKTGQIKNQDTGCITKYTINLNCRNCNSLIQFPNVITPNGDYINEYFTILEIIEEPSKYQQNELLIFNLNNQLVFWQKNYSNNWNGIDNNGKMLPVGTYFYIFKFDKLMESVKGKITIVR